jgi:hypothetical protein
MVLRNLPDAGRQPEWRNRCGRLILSNHSSPSDKLTSGFTEVESPCPLPRASLDRVPGYATRLAETPLLAPPRAAKLYRYESQLGGRPACRGRRFEKGHHRNRRCQSDSLPSVERAHPSCTSPTGRPSPSSHIHSGSAAPPSRPRQKVREYGGTARVGDPIRERHRTVEDQVQALEQR